MVKINFILFQLHCLEIWPRYHVQSEVKIWRNDKHESENANIETLSTTINWFLFFKTPKFDNLSVLYQLT